MANVDIDDLLNKLSLEEKVLLLSGADGWQTQEICRVGIGSLKTTDGPAGARGALSIDGPTAAFLPAPVAQAATWSKELLYRIGKLLCKEAKSKAAQVLLAPTICCARNPLGGRNFESYSEDPFLSGSLVIESVRGIQETGEVFATIKHFVANEQEHERLTIDAKVSEKALHEIYLKPFEMVIKSANPPGCVMTSYNCVNGEHMDMNNLLEKTLRGDWGFSGLVMSDWGGCNSTVESVIAGLDLEMPGPPERRSKRLMEYLAKNESKDLLAAIDKSCSRVLNLLGQLGLLGLTPEEASQTRKQVETSSESLEDRQLLRSVGADGIVLLKNSAGILPLIPSKLEGTKIALIGPNAVNGTPGGGGSATMNPQYQTQPFETLKTMLKAKGIQAETRYSIGAYTEKWLPLITPDRWYLGPDSPKDATLKLEFFGTPDFSGPIIETQFRANSYMDLFDSSPREVYTNPRPYSLIVTSSVTPTSTGLHSLEVSSVGNSRVFVDDELLIGNVNWTEVGETFYAFGSQPVRKSMKMTAGQTYKIRIEAGTKINPKTGAGVAGEKVFGTQPCVRFGFLEEIKSDEEITDEAVKAAQEADIVVCVLGLNAEWESEGYDRKDMLLPSAQDKLANRLLKESGKSDKIIFVNQSGSPVHMPWAGEASTIVQAWYGGQEAGNSLWDVLTGVYSDLAFEGRPETWPGIDGVVKYEDGVSVGYRYYQNKKVDPRWWFGYGLSYTTFEVKNLMATKSDGGWELSVNVKNVGSSEGRDVVQVYSSPEAGGIRELKGFQKTGLLKPGEEVKVSVTVRVQDLAEWEGKWVTKPGGYKILVGKHAGDLEMLECKIVV